MLIDTHCHLLKEDYENVDEIISHMGNNIMIACGTNPKDNLEVIELCKKYPNIYGTIGFYPGELEGLTDDYFKLLEEQLQLPKIVGIGEIGLDYHYGKDNKEEQKKWFEKQIELAQKLDKTIVIHSRDAAEDTYEILKNHHVEKNRVVMHCYSYSVEMAKKFTALGVMLGIGGVVTFHPDNTLSQVVKEIDLDYLLLETDSPYLTPKPYRGHKNEPKNVGIVAEKISEIKGISKENVVFSTASNAVRQFDLNIKVC